MSLNDVEVRMRRRAAYASVLRFPESRQSLMATKQQQLLYEALRDRYERASPALRAAGFDINWARFNAWYDGWKENAR